MSEFRLPDKVAIIEIDDGAFAGAEIRASLRLPLGKLRDVLSALDDLEKSDNPFDLLALLGDIFCERLIEWNLVDAKGPLPPNREGWDRLDVAEAAAIIAGWVSGIAQPSVPLPQPSSVTEPLLADSENGRRSSSSPQSQQASLGPSFVTPS